MTDSSPYFFVLIYLSCIQLLDQKFNRFLWGGTDLHIARAKVAWDEICVPKRKGGLGL